LDPWHDLRAVSSADVERGVERSMHRKMPMNALAVAPAPWPAPAASVPTAVADAVLDAAVGSDADHVWIEPAPENDEHYMVSIERDGEVLAKATLDASLGAAVIARLAFLTDIDLTSRTVVTGATRLRTPTAQRDLVFTMRPGAQLRAEGMLVARGTRPRLQVVHDQLAPGDLVDHYRVVARLGEGGMGTVYHVEQATLGRAYALKVLHGHQLALGMNSVEQFLREARAAARLRHPHIVDVFDFGYLPDGRPYFVMELLAGTSVQALTDEGALKPVKAVSMARQLADALATAHEHGVIHADISAGNVLVCEGDAETHVKLVDFGLAELRGPTPTPPTIADVVYGTPSYIAPEVARGHAANEHSDQYSFGILLYEMLTGKVPFIREDVREVCRAHIFEPLPEPLSPYGTLPAELLEIVERCCSKSPSTRYPSMRAVHAELVAVARVMERRGWRKWLSP
jgi:hypothetical protein